MCSCCQLILSPCHYRFSGCRGEMFWQIWTSYVLYCGSAWIFFFLLLQIVRWWSYIWNFPSMVQKPHRERKFIDCHLTRRKASCSFCMIPPWAFVFSQLDLSSLLFINVSSVYWVMTDSNWPAYFHSLWREAIQRLRQHIKVRKKKSDSEKMREKEPLTMVLAVRMF